MTAYTIFKSNKTDAVFIPDASTGTGINNVSTSLKLVGRGYANYGQAFAENFLHLLENFASPYPGPANPTEGQLWYQTEVGGNTNVNNLMIFDGINWISATGYYHEDTDPTEPSGVRMPYSVNNGDMWFDTAKNVLSIRNNGQWITIGPSISGTAKTGTESYTLADSANPSLQYSVVLNWADGSVVSVFSSAPAFLPNTYPLGMDGFDVIYPGITVKKTNSQLGRIIAKADDSSRLDGISASSYLRKDDSTNIGQKIIGKVVFETPNAAAQENRDGLIVRVAGTSPVDYLQVYQTRPSDRNPGAAVVANNSPGGKIIFKTNTNGNLTDVVTIDGKNLTIAGKQAILSTVPATSTSTGALTIEGGVGIAGNVYAKAFYAESGERNPIDTAYWNGGRISSTLFIDNTETSTVGTVSGALRVAGGASILREVYIGSTTTITSTATSLSTTTGALVVAGGAGVGKDVTVGGTLKVSGQTTIVDLASNTILVESTATSSSTSTGALQVAGGAGIGGNVNVSGYGRFTGTFDESTTTVGVYVGVAGSLPASPRIVFAAGTGTNWEIDNYSGSLRIFRPSGVVISINGSTSTFSGDVTINGNTTVNNSLVNIPGTMMPYAGSTVPTGWLLCDGSTSTNVSLFNTIGYNYGTGTNISWFYLPNLYTTSTIAGTSTFATTYYIIKT
jgi:hypothetical protein